MEEWRGGDIWEEEEKEKEEEEEGLHDLWAGGREEEEGEKGNHASTDRERER